VNADVMDDENVWMIKCTCGLRFLFEAIKPIRIFRKGGRQDFDRHIATELRISRAPNLTHAAFANLGDNGVLSDRRVGGNPCAHSIGLG